MNKSEDVNASNEGKILSPRPSFVWPESRVIAGDSSYGFNPPVLELISSADTMFGVVHGVTASGAEWLESILDSSPGLAICLILTTYPACPTRSETLERLLKLQASQDEETKRCEIRIFTGKSVTDRPSSLLCLLSESGDAPVFLSNMSGNFGLESDTAFPANLCFQANAALMQQFRNWFDFNWWEAHPLNAKSVNIPRLVPARGEESAARMWDEYILQCGSPLDPEVAQAELFPEETREKPAQITVDKKTGEVKAVNKDNTPRAAPTEVLKVPRVNLSLLKVADMFSGGTLATIDGTSRIPPLDCPIKAAWFGVETLRQVGTASRKIEFRVAGLDEKELKKLNNFRNRTRVLLNVFSFPIADGARWIPNAARSLLEEELERVNQEGQTFLAETVGDDAAAYIPKRREIIKRDTQGLYAEVHPGKTVPEDVLKKIEKQLVDRLTKATGGQILPRLAYIPIQSGLATESKWSSQWGHASVFLHGVAEYPRKCLTDHYFMRGLKVKQESLLKAMDVANDRLLVDHLADRRVTDRAHEELELLRKISASSSDDECKCTAMLALIAGEGKDEIDAALNAKPSTADEDSTLDSNAELEATENA